MSPTIVFFLLLTSGFSFVSTEAKLPANAYDIFFKALIKTFQTPISSIDSNSKLSVEIMLANDVFNLDDALRLFIQQYLIALYNGNIHLISDDWPTEYPAYGKVIEELNNILDLIGSKTLSQISMKDIRPLIESLTPEAFADFQQLNKVLEERAKEESDSEKEEL